MTPILPQYIYPWLLLNYEQTRELGSGNNQPAMDKTIVEGIAFPLPPLAEQETIVEATVDQLSVIDHLEADIQTKLKATESLRQSILRHAFAGKLVPQDPRDEPASELLARIAAERATRTREATAAKRAAKPATGPERPNVAGPIRYWNLPDRTNPITRTTRAVTS